MSTTAAHIRWDVSPSAEAMAERAARWVTDRAAETDGPFHLCLSGGSTPAALYRLLAQAPLKSQMPWDRTHVFWGDERFVPHADKLSNYRMARETLLDHAPIPPGNIHPIPTEGVDPEEAAELYEAVLQADGGKDGPLFDVTLLGLGEDGHTASLFPAAKDALAERKRWVVAVTGVKEEPRISLTYPALDASRHLAFLVAGKDKAAILARFAAGDHALPAARVQPSGDLWVFTDTAAKG